MKTNNNKTRFNWMISRISVLVVFVSILMGPWWSALASTQNDETISCGEFIAMLANHQPGNPLFPSGYSQLSKEELYLQTVQNMSAKGFRVLDGKSFHDPLEATFYRPFFEQFWMISFGIVFLRINLLFTHKWFLDFFSTGWWMRNN